MKGIVRPSEVSSLVPISFPSHIYDNPENIEKTYGIISKNNLWMCLVHNTCINIFSTETGRWCGKYCFADSLNNPSAKVTNVVEFISSHIAYQCILVSINQDDESQICMFNVDTGSVVQSVLIPEKISSLDVVSGDGGVCMETHYLNKRLRYMFGVVVVGTVNGHIYFLDLCLDESFECDETMPNITLVLGQYDCSAQKREAAIARKQHIFLRLNDENDPSGKYSMHNASAKIKYACDITAIKYIKSLAFIAAGFKFGGIQLWELSHLTQQYTIPSEPHNQPVVDFAFQEPENDPRHFCYLWVFRGHNALNDKQPESVSCATMYSMTFDKRELVKSFGPLYTDLILCNKRFEFPFTNDVYHNSLINPSMSSRLLSCQVISQKDLCHAPENVSGNESCEIVEETSLCFIAWEVWNHPGSDPSSCHFAVFDLNQWYQAQMPCMFRCDPSSLSPYFGIFSLEETKRVLGRKELLGVFPVPQSVKKFKSLQVSEEFFYPSSLGFQSLSFSSNGLCRTTYFGFQKHLLFEMADLGPKILINPKEVFSALFKCGLVSDALFGIEKTSLGSQREAILQLALEYHLPFFFVKCLREWRYSDSAHEYCTSKALLNWAWKKVMVIKTSIDRLSVTLFNCSGVDIDKRAVKSLYAYRRQLNLIDNVISGYQKYVTPRTEQGIQDLQCRREALSCINLYLQVLLWLRSIHVLPEVCEDEETDSSVVYRFNDINKSYLCRRSALQALNSSIGATDVLLIDGLVKEIGIGGSWQEKNGSGMYPPPSIYAALSTYLLDGVAANWKHAVIYYILLDIRSSVKNVQFHADVKKFPVIFNMPKSMVKLVKAFWYLDRKDCVNGIRKILDPAVKSCDILMWQHHRIIKSCLYHRNPEKALKYINHVNPPQNSIEDIRLYLSVLLACGAITQAFEYQRKKQNEGYGNDLMKHLFLGCQEMGKMRELMYLPLNSLESSMLVQFLSDSENLRAQETLVIYHLLHCNFFEAEKINEKLSLSLVKKRHTSAEVLINERSVDRNNLVECLLAGVSRTEKNLVSEISRLPLEFPRKEEYLKQPLSVSVRSNTMKSTSYSDFLRSLLAKTSISKYPQTPRTPGSGSVESLPFLRPINTPESVRNPLVVKNTSVSVNKRLFMTTSPNECTTPAKRSRLLDNATFMESPSSKRKTPRHLVGDIASLLQTPPIHRRVSLARSNPGTPIVKPQSILKKSTSTVMDIDADIHRAVTPPVLTLDESSDENEEMQIDGKNSEQLDKESESESRQIRFDLPLAEQSIVSENISICSEVAADDDDVHETTLISPEKAEASWKKSVLSSTRESPSGILKHPPPVSTSDCYSRFESDSGIESTVNFAGGGDTHADGSSRKTGFNTPVSQRKCVSIRPPIREETFLETENPKSDQNITNKEKSMLEKSTSEGDFAAGDTTITVEESDEEMFYSPCSSIASPPDSTLTRNKALDDSYTWKERMRDVHEVLFKEDSIISKETEKSRKTFVFSRPSTSTNSTGAIPKNVQIPHLSHCLENTACSVSEERNKGEISRSINNDANKSQASASSIESYKPSRKTFIFTRNKTQTSTTISDSSGTIKDSAVSGIDSGNNVKSGEDNTVNLPKSNSQLSESSLVFSSMKNAKPSRKTFVFTRSKTQTSTTITDTTTSFPSNAELDVDSGDNLDSQKSRETFIFSKPDEVASADHSSVLNQPNVSRTFIFAQPKSLTEELDNQHINLYQRNPSKTFLFGKPDSSSSITNQTFQVEKPKTSRKTFVFTRSQTSASSATDIASNETSAVKANETQPKSFDSFVQPAPLNKPSRKTFTATDMTSSETSAVKASEKQPKAFDSFVQPAPLNKPSRKTFVFTRTSTLNSATDSGTGSSVADESSKASDKTFVSTRSSSKDKQNKVEMHMKTEILNPSTNEDVDAAETYEEFSSTLSKNTPYKNVKSIDNTKRLLSSPLQKDSEVPSEPVQSAEFTEGKKTGSVQKPKKKGKSRKKIEFSFSEPHSPAASDVLEALSQTPEQQEPLPSFLFSPPLTRGRLRRKAMDDTMGSSFASVTSEASFSTSVKNPPMDPILEGIIQEKTLQTKKSSKKQVKSTGRKKTPRTVKTNESALDVSNQTNISLNESAASTSTLKTPSSARHSMVLRQMRSTKKADISFN